MARKFHWVLVVLMVTLVAGCGGQSEPQITAEAIWARPSLTMPPVGENSGSMTGDAGKNDETALEKGTDGAMDADPAMGATGAVFMTLTNAGGQADMLVSAETDVATVVELHRTTMKDGVMNMSPVDGIEIPAGGQVVLKPGDYHIMLLGLNRDLQVGDEFGVKLRFDKSEPLVLKVTVKEM